MRKYGVVPAAAFPDSDPAQYTRTLHTMLRVLLLQTAARVRAAPDDGAARRNRRTLHRVHRLLCACLRRAARDGHVGRQDEEGIER